MTLPTPNEEDAQRVAMCGREALVERHILGAWRWDIRFREDLPSVRD